MHYLTYCGLFLTIGLMFMPVVSAARPSLRCKASTVGVFFWSAAPFAAYAAYLTYQQQQAVAFLLYAFLTASLLVAPIWFHWKMRRLSRLVEQLAVQRKNQRQGRNNEAA